MTALLKCRCGYERLVKRELHRRANVNGITCPCEACAQWANDHDVREAVTADLSGQETLADIRERQAKRLQDIEDRLSSAMRGGQ